MKKKPFKLLQWALLLLAIIVSCSGCIWVGPGYYHHGYYHDGYWGGGYYHRDYYGR